MIDKSLVKKRFKKSFATYDENAYIQKHMAEKLTDLVLKFGNKYKNVFEIGCATGLLTKEIKKKIEYESFIANDLVEESVNYITEIEPEINFIQGDIEEIKLEKKYDLIISNAALQWCNNIGEVIKELVAALNPEGILAFTVFSDANLQEIRNIFEIENRNFQINEIKEILNKYQIEVFEKEIIKYDFENVKAILRHIKYTGVNAIKEIKLTKAKLKEYEEKYIKTYKKARLTYNPVYVVIKK